MNNNQSLREFLGGQAANKADNSTDTQLHSHGQQMNETFQDNDFCCFRQFRLILSGKNRIFCTAGFALSGVQGVCQSGLPAEKIESLTVDTAFRVCLLLVSQSSAGSVIFSFLFFLIYFFLSIWAECQKLWEAIFITHILSREVLYCLAVFFFLSPPDVPRAVSENHF